VRRAVLRLGVARDDFAAPVERLAVERFAVDLRAAEARLAVPADFARDVDLFAPVVRDAVDFRAVDLRAEDLRAVALRPLLLRVERAAEAELVLLDEPSSVHLPDITRCAASATASAMIAPSLVALDTTLLAAWVAVSAASSPASRILRRADGLALIAAAAAASPAASISLLIAALASLSTVAFFDRDEDEDDFEVDLEELFRADFAIALSPSVRRKTL